VRRRSAAALSVALAGAACNALTGVGDLTVGAPDADTTRADASVSPPVEAGVPSDAGAGADADAASCQPRPNLLGVGKATAYRSTTTKTIDGVGADWGCDTGVAMMTGTSSTIGDAGAYGARVNVEWDPSALYLYYDVTLGGPPQGTNATQPQFNDAVELYVSGDVPRTGDYGPTDYHLIVDHAGRAGRFTATSETAATGATAVAVATAVGFRVEMRLAATAFGVQALSAGNVLPFDLQISRGDSTTQLGAIHFVVMAQAPPSCACASCCCGTAKDYPYCDDATWGTLTLE
jgi:hypothetical protein